MLNGAAFRECIRVQGGSTCRVQERLQRRLRLTRAHNRTSPSHTISNSNSNSNTTILRDFPRRPRPPPTAPAVRQVRTVQTLPQSGPVRGPRYRPARVCEARERASGASNPGQVRGPDIGLPPTFNMDVRTRRPPGGGPSPHHSHTSTRCIYKFSHLLLPMTAIHSQLERTSTGKNIDATNCTTNCIASGS